MRALIRAGADVNAATAAGTTPLQSPSNGFGRPDALEAGADPGVGGADGQSALARPRARVHAHRQMLVEHDRTSACGEPGPR